MDAPKTPTYAFITHAPDAVGKAFPVREIFGVMSETFEQVDGDVART